MITNKMRKIIVVGVVHHNTLGMVRCLGSARFHIDLILVGHDGYISKSRYVKRTILATDESEIINILQNNYGNEREKQIVIACTDKASSVLDLNYNKIKDSFLFFNCGDYGKATYCMNKQVQVEIANSVGITTPCSYEYKGELQKTIFPCLLKPVQSINGGKKVVICYDEKELQTGLSSFSKQDVVLVQQFIKKEFEIVVLGCSTDKGVVIPGYIMKHRDFDGGTLFSTVCPIEELPSEFVEKCKRMIEAMKYSGLFGIEFIKSNNQYYFIEANLRNDATTYALAVAGANLPEYYVNSFFKEDNKIPHVAKRIDAIVEFNDYKHRKDYNVGLCSWLKQYFSSKCKYYWNCKDPIPFFFAPFK